MDHGPCYLPDREGNDRLTCSGSAQRSESRHNPNCRVGWNAQIDLCFSTKFHTADPELRGMSPQTSPPDPTRDRPGQPIHTDEPLEVTDIQDGHTVPALLLMGGLFVIYLAALTAVGVRRAVLRLRSAVGGTVW